MSIIPSFAQVVEGDFTIDVNHGLIGGRKGLVYTLIENSDATTELSVDEDLVTSYTGPIAGRLEYMMSKDFGIGLEANYTKRLAEWTDISSRSIYNETTGEYDYIRANTKYSLSQTVVRIMLRTNYIFVNEEELQIGYANSIGYRLVQWDFEPLDDEFTDILNLSTWPLAFRTAIGMRYFIAENIGLNAEIGFSGGAYINGGVSIKLKTKTEPTNTETL